MNAVECTYAKLKVCSFGFAMGLLKGFGMMFLAWSAMQWGYGSAYVGHLQTFYHGYAASFMGGFYGLLWGFVCGFIFGGLFAYFYNFCLACAWCKKK